MKSIIFTIVILALAVSLIAQSNLQIVDPAKRWSYMEHQSWAPPLWVRFPYYVKFSGDTTINQLNYLKIWETDEEDSTNWYQQGFIRSDSNGDIYMRDLIDNEGLVYKFDVNPGDTFSVSNPFHIYDFVAEVAEVDQVFIGPANEYRKRIKIIDYEGISWGEEEYWIEGIGSMAGIITSGFHLYSLTGGVHDALCQWQNNSLVYSNPGFNFCFNIVSTPEISDEPIGISINPNPLKNKSKVVIEGLADANCTLLISDMYDKKIIEYNFKYSKEITIERRLFNSGLYIISLIDRNNIIARKKLIVQ